MKNQSIDAKRLKHYILLVFIYLFVRMNSYFTKGAANEQLLLVCRIVIILFSFFLLFRIRYVPKKGWLFIAVATNIWFFLSGIQNCSNITTALTNFSTQAWWATFLVITYILLVKTSDSEIKSIIYIGVFSFYVFSARYAIWLLSGNRYWSSGGINSIYYCVLLLPLCYLVDKRIIKYSMLFIAALLTIITCKRTALISIICCAFLPPILEKGGKRSKKKTGTLLLLMLVCIVLVYVAKYLSKSIDITIIQRMQSLQEDGGSGRTTTYALVWEAFKGSNIIKKIFGHGYNAVFLDRISISSAHNDFLEVIYDYGIIGLLLYVSMLCTFIKCAFRLRSVQGKSFSAYTAALLIYIILSCVSHLIIYPTYNVFLLFVFSIGFAEIETLQSDYIEGWEDE